MQRTKLTRPQSDLLRSIAAGPTTTHEAYRPAVALQRAGLVVARERGLGAFGQVRWDVTALGREWLEESARYVTERTTPSKRTIRQTKRTTS